jgi:hypothetical protein
VVMSRRFKLWRASLERTRVARLRRMSRRVVFGRTVLVFRFLVPNYCQNELEGDTLS